MSILALEVHDGGLLVVDEDGLVSSPSPGYALFDAGTVITGTEALGRAREKPRWVNNRFWHDLEMTPLGRPFPRDLTLADLAHAHLSELWRTLPAGASQVLLATPGSFTSRQLGVLLGITQACSIPVAGIVDTAVAATVAAALEPTFQRLAAGTRRLLHLDLHLHQAMLTELEMTVSPIASDPLEARVVRRRVVVDAGIGWTLLQDLWVRRIAELFVQTTRFDPLHSAATEQQLGLRLPEWLATLRGAELVELQVGPEGAVRSLELTRADLVDAVDGVYDQFLELILAHKRAGEPVALLLAPRVAELPGLASRLSGLRDVTTVSLPAGCAGRGALRARQELLEAGAHNADSPSEAAGGLPLVTRASFAIPAAPPAPAEAPAPQAEPPSHLLIGGLAYPLGERPLTLGSAAEQPLGLQLDAAGVAPRHCTLRLNDGRLEIEDHSGGSTWLNLQPVAAQARLEIGDRLQLGSPGVEAQLIKVLGSAGEDPLEATAGASPAAQSSAAQSSASQSSASQSSASQSSDTDQRTFASARTS